MQIFERKKVLFSLFCRKKGVVSYTIRLSKPSCARRFGVPSYAGRYRVSPLYSLVCRVRGAGGGVRFRRVGGLVLCAGGRGLFLAVDCGGFADFLERLLQGGNIGFGRVKNNGDLFLFQIADEVLDTLLEGDILFNLGNTPLAVDGHVKHYRLALRLGKSADGKQTENNIKDKLFHLYNC